MEKLPEIILTCFYVTSGYFILYYIVSLILFLKKSKSDSNLKLDPISVVIAAKNEYDNLKEFLPLIMNQKEVEFEVVVVDDCSVDQSRVILEEYQARFPNFNYSFTTETKLFSGGKKMALSIGIKKAKFEKIAFIDADCYPSSELWLKELSKKLDKRPIVIGYGAYEKKGGILNALIRFDAEWIAHKYLSWAQMGFPYMAVGRNMGYRSHLFFNNKGFSNHMHLKSGDDDLFMNEVAKTKMTAVLLCKEAYTISKAPLTIKEWIKQKRRHLTTGSSYSVKNKILLFVQSLMDYSFYTSLVALLLFKIDYQLWIYVLIGKVLTHLLTFYFFERKINRLALWYLAPLLDIILLLFYPTIVALNLIERSNEWKKY